MPRKRKKSALAQKPSLVFTESPVHVQKNVPSPVLCARHPPTASIIPVEEVHNLHWVSPQFRNVRHSGGHGKRRLTRQRRHSIAGHRNVVSCIGTKENIPYGVPSGLNKFKSLKFIGDQTTIPSIMEDVEVTIDSDTATEDDGENCAGYNYEINDNDSPCDGCTKNPKSVTTLGNYKRLHLGMPGCPIEREGNSGGNSAETQKNDSEALASEKGIKLEFPERSFEEDQSINGTQSRDTKKEKPPIKRLFASQLPSNCGGDGKKLCPDFSEDFDNVKLIGKVTEITDLSLKVLDSDEQLINSPSVRRSARIRKIQEILQSSDSPRGDRTHTFRKTVLAPNTPEIEYGWSKRKRQLIQYIKKKS